MTFTVGTYEIEIKAKDTLISKKNNIDDTLAVVNSVLIYMCDRLNLNDIKIDGYREQGDTETADLFERVGDINRAKAYQLFDQMKNYQENAFHV